MPETIVGTTDPDHIVIHTMPGAVTEEIVIADGDRDTAVVVLSPQSGASSDADASSGIPSARRQRTGTTLATESTHETTLADRAQTMQQDLEP